MASLRRLMMKVQTSAFTLPALANEKSAELYERLLNLDGKAAEYKRYISMLAKQARPLSA